MDCVHRQTVWEALCLRIRVCFVEVVILVWPFIGRKTLLAGERSRDRGGKRNPWGAGGKHVKNTEVGKNGALGTGGNFSAANTYDVCEGQCER